MRASNTRQMSWLAFSKAAYGKHPYGRSVVVTWIAWPAWDGEIVDFYDRHYGPQDMIIGVAGALPADMMLKR